MREAEGRVVGRGGRGAFISDASVTPSGPGPPPGAPSILLLWGAPGWDEGGARRCFPPLCLGRARGWLAEDFGSRRCMGGTSRQGSGVCEPFRCGAARRGGYSCALRANAEAPLGVRLRPAPCGKGTEMASMMTRCSFGERELPARRIRSRALKA